MRIGQTIQKHDAFGHGDRHGITLRDNKIRQIKKNAIIGHKSCENKPGFDNI